MLDQPTHRTKVRRPAAVAAALALLCALVPACDESAGPEPETNTAPTMPSSPSPANNATDQPRVLQLEWLASDPDGDELTYDVYFGTQSNPPAVQTGGTEQSYAVEQLDPETTYYWKVSAQDAQGARTTGPVWRFVTNADPAPIISGPPVPANGAAEISIESDIQWTVSDPEGGPMLFDVYFGETADPPLLVSDVRSQKWGPLPLAPLKTYYWYIVARDEDGNKTTGPMWTFQTARTCNLSGYVERFWGTGIPGRGDDGGPPAETQLYWPIDVAFDADGNPYVCDWNNHRVLVLDEGGNSKTLIGGQFGDGEDGIAEEIHLNHPTHVSFEPSGNLILSAWHNSLLKRMDMSTRYIATFCGNGQRDYGGDGGPAADAIVDLPVTTLVDDQGRMFIGDQANMCIRYIDTDGIISTIVGLPRDSGYYGDGGPANQARLFFERGQAANPSGRICFDPDGNLYIADTRNHAIRKVQAAGLTEGTATITTIAGRGPANAGYSGDGGLAVNATLHDPRDVACDADGNLYIADTGNHCIRMVDTHGIITTVAGTPTVYGDENDCIPATDATLTGPFGIAIDDSGNLWIAATQNNRVLVVYK